MDGHGVGRGISTATVRRPAVLTQVLGIVYRAVSTFLVRRAGLRVGAGARTGAVTLIQRFGSALNLNPHLHMLFVDGAYAFHDEAPRFHRVAAPTQAGKKRQVGDETAQLTVPQPRLIMTAYHRLVHEGGFDVQRLDDGAFRFTNRYGVAIRPPRTSAAVRLACAG